MFTKEIKMAPVALLVLLILSITNYSSSLTHELTIYNSHYQKVYYINYVKPDHKLRGVGVYLSTCNFEMALTFDDVTKKCASLGLEVIKPRSMDEFEIISNYMKDSDCNKSYFIGVEPVSRFSHEFSLKYHDGQLVPFDVSFGDDWNTNSTCVTLKTDGNRVKVSDCNDQTFAYVCEKQLISTDTN